MTTFEQHLQARTTEDLVIKLPEEFLNKSFVVKVEEDASPTINSDGFFVWLRSLGVKTKPWKFNREEANER